MSQIPTPHIEATSKDEIAKVVLMPGDPLRAQKISGRCNAIQPGSRHARVHRYI
jgi:purine-nucleoside phosphorylase